MATYVNMSHHINLNNLVKNKRRKILEKLGERTNEKGKAMFEMENLICTTKCPRPMYMYSVVCTIGSSVNSN
jgi:hypothetical protein